MYVFEQIEKAKEEAKIFIAYIEESRFHWHYEYELILVLKGSVKLKYPSKSLVLQRGDIVMLNSKWVHEIQKTNEENLCLFVQISKNMFKDPRDENKEYEFYLNSKDEVIPLKKDYNYFIKLLAKLGLENFKQDLTSHYRKKSLLFQLVADFFEFVPYHIIQKASISYKVREVNRLMDMLKFIEDNCKDKNVLENLSRDMGMCEKTMYRFLKNSIGLTPKELLSISRVEKAKEMLIDGDKSIEYIVFECGFNAKSTFYRVFKKIVGVTPKKYRIDGVKRQKKSKEESKVKGYLSFNEGEAKKSLIKLMEEEIIL